MHRAGRPVPRGECERGVAAPRLAERERDFDRRPRRDFDGRSEREARIKPAARRAAERGVRTQSTRGLHAPVPADECRAIRRVGDLDALGHPGGGERHPVGELGRRRVLSEEHAVGNRCLDETACRLWLGAEDEAGIARKREPARRGAVIRKTDSAQPHRVVGRHEVSNHLLDLVGCAADRRVAPAVAYLVGGGARDRAGRGAPHRSRFVVAHIERFAVGIGHRIVVPRGEPVLAAVVGPRVEPSALRHQAADLLVGEHIHPRQGRKAQLPLLVRLYADHVLRAISGEAAVPVELLEIFRGQRLQRRARRQRRGRQRARHVLPKRQRAVHPQPRRALDEGGHRVVDIAGAEHDHALGIGDLLAHGL